VKPNTGGAVSNGNTSKNGSIGTGSTLGLSQMINYKRNKKQPQRGGTCTGASRNASNSTRTTARGGIGMTSYTEALHSRFGTSSDFD
jgi:hypothetical protein